MSKTMSIYEFSKISGVESSTLRYWDEIGLFSPVMRNPNNNYRHYTIAQLPSLNLITTLSNLEVPLKKISELINERDPEILLDLFDELKHLMDMQIYNLSMQSSIIHARSELIKLGLKANNSHISISALVEKRMIIWPRNEYKEGDTFLVPLSFHYPHVEKHHINLSFPIGGYHDDFESFVKSPGCPNHFISYGPTGLHKRKAGEHIVGYTRGGYGELGDLPERMVAYANEHSLRIKGPIYTLYLHDMLCKKDPSDFFAQCSAAIECKKSTAPKK